MTADQQLRVLLGEWPETVERLRRGDRDDATTYQARRLCEAMIAVLDHTTPDQDSRRRDALMREFKTTHPRIYLLPPL